MSKAGNKLAIENSRVASTQTLYSLQFSHQIVVFLSNFHFSCVFLAEYFNFITVVISSLRANQIVAWYLEIFIQIISIKLDRLHSKKEWLLKDNYTKCIFLFFLYKQAKNCLRIVRIFRFFAHPDSYLMRPTFSDM